MSTITASLREEKVRIPCPGVVLDGDLSIPEHARGLVIFAHGSGSSRMSPRNRWVAREMHRKHLATLLFDLLTPEEAEAEALTCELRFDIPLLTGRLVSASVWARRQAAVQDLGIGYFGASTGAAAALVAAAEMPGIQAVVSRGGRTDLAGDAVARVLAPTLLVVGSQDDSVLRWNQETLERLPCVKRLSVVEGATHLFPEPGALERVADLAGNWFAIHLTKTSTAS